VDREGSARLGLSGVVAAEDLRAVLDGRCPTTDRCGRDP